MKTAALLACCLFSTMVFAQPPCKSSATGDLHVETFESTTYGESQTLRIWLPNAYTESANAQTKYPVLYVLDGQNLFDDCTAFANESEWRADETIAGLIAAKKIDPLIVVGIDSGPKRKHQYRVYRDDITDASAPDPIGAKLPAFLANEVLPYVGARYRVTSDPRRTGIGGASLAGVAASFILLNRPDLFGVGLIESATLPLGNGQMLRDSAHIAFGPDRVFVGVGTTELAIPGGD
jgi:enterochelin esterase-like enzyme